ncbi:MAG: 2-C-methyl-D-erythritol 2,4-cyclodiphosphate synthase [Gammaproteobacteria bacterium]|jgi:2-C-methyl-D-erythritol 2,4-cyclodiphosphate synthase|nr:2-C-methyl-D-erythritol 2,4-cyclodiphosphate synthase [Gammaproteobacteria bacterium]MEC9224024.1 2-C-methyl-D-erythritol 2,4-cyclodiphosphate synthase [Pseudomonadota bacterium]|tara:strand:+ start:1267 stop:1770 length:504 start_codon:yes stop_codon:yes gene_type:complete
MKADSMRIGHGFDVHRFTENFDISKPLKLAGRLIPEELSLEAHSDGDLVLHAVCDAMLGAMAIGDIGEHFPCNNAALAGIDSAELLERVLQLADKNQFRLVNVDVTVIAQVPKLSPYRYELRDSLSSLLQMDSDRVNLKASTTEQLGYIGRKEGMACHAVVLMHTNA